MRYVLVSLVATLLAGSASVGLSDDERIDFNRDVRPIFNQHCIACHGGVKQAGELSFVYEDQALAMVDPGDPEASYLIDRVTAGDDEERMPPAEHGRALNDQEVATLRKWIKQGANWGTHWAFIAPETHQPPNDPDDNWSRSSLDRFILARLTQAGLDPANDADPGHLLRRVSLDLTGLPPTPEQRSHFLSEWEQHGVQAYAAEVDRLLSSPAFGERWASVWLDVVRYADSRGLGLDGRRTIWKYRDWVIRSLNQDMPYDEFTIGQLAGDLLPDASLDDLVATACHRLTQTNEEGGTDDEMFRVEAVIDRVNTTWQAWQGLSFGCVQCHSHPYDPIRHEEYYQFLAFFNNTADCDLSTDEPSAAVPLDDAETEAAWALDQQIHELWMEQWQPASALLQDDSRWQPLTGMTATTDSQTKVVVQSVDGVEEYQTRGNVAKETTVTIESRLPEFLDQLTALRFTGLPQNADRAKIDSEWGFVLSHVTASLLAADGEERPLDIAFVIADEPEPLLDPQLSLNGKSQRGFGAYTRMNYSRSAAFVLSGAVDVHPGDQLRVSLSQNIFNLGAFPLVAHRGRVAVSGDNAFTRWWTDESQVAARTRLADLKQQREVIKSVDIPVMIERPQQFARSSFVFDRGNFLTKTDPVTPATPDFLPKLSDGERVSFNRLDLARWIASADNPLTARVAVNRVWAQLFGTGLVETQEDFGASGTPPSHPLLLDDLATRFQTDMGWSTKLLLRELVLSSTYRQSSQTTPQKLDRDPRNRLLSRGPKLRLPAESVRDQALAISGLLSHKQFGPPVHPPIPDGLWKPFQAGDKWTTPDDDSPDRYRRTVYT